VRRAKSDNRGSWLFLPAWCVIATLLAASLTGCTRSPRTSMAQLLDRVPSFGWPNGEEEPAETTAEPKVTANSATALASNSSVDEPSDSAEADADPFVARLDPAPIITELAPADPFLAISGALPEPLPDQRMQELKAALTADVERDAVQPSTFSSPHPLRLRVDGLLRRARELADAEHYAEARRSAQLAVDLTDALALEFLPNEERPTDLLRQIDEHLAANRPQPALPTVTPALTTTQSETQSDAQGTVAANQAIGLRPKRIEEPMVTNAVEADSPGSAAVENADLAPDAVPIADEPLLAMSDGARQLPVLDEPAPLPLDAAPPPPQLDDIEPLPAYRGKKQPRATTTHSAANAAREPLHWTDWMPLGALGIILMFSGTALGWRRWRYGS
jgi:hypothetical protein